MAPIISLMWVMLARLATYRASITSLSLVYIYIYIYSQDGKVRVLPML